MAEADIALIKRNIGKMIAAGAPEADIDAYLGTTGVTLDALKAPAAPAAPAPAAPAAPAAPGMEPGLADAFIAPGGEGDPAKSTWQEPIVGLAKAAGQGVAEGVVGATEMAQTVGEGALKIGAKAGGAIRSAIGIPFSPAEQRIADEAMKVQLPRMGTALREGAGITYEPKNVEEEYAKTFGNFASNGFKPSVGGVLAGVLIPGAASEAAGQAAKGKPYEGVVRALGAVAGGGAAGGAAAAARPSAIAGMTRRAADFAINTVKDGRYAKMEEGLKRLGQEATFGDVSPAWLGVQRGAAMRDDMRDEIVGVLDARHKAANTRYRASEQRNLGPAPVREDILDPKTGELARNRQALGPRFDEVFDGPSARAVDTSDLARALEAEAVKRRGDAQREAIKVRGDLDIHGAPGTLDPDPRTLHATRESIDGKLFDPNQTDGNVRKVLGDARKAVDEKLAEAVPGIKDVDAQFAELKRQEEAFKRGETVFDTGRETAIHPTTVKRIMEKGHEAPGNSTLVGPSAVPHRLKQGARTDIDRIVGNNANDPLAVQRTVKGEGDWGREKLGHLFGKDKADDFLNTVDAEATFAKNGARVAAGSDTELGRSFNKFLAETEKSGAVNTGASLPGLAIRAVQKAVGMGSEARALRQGKRVAEDLGILSVSQGEARDRFMQELKAGLEKQGVPPGQAAVIAAAMAARASTAD